MHTPPPALTPPTSQLDHLVVLASTLNEGVRWCENVLGTAPGPGGEHALMGTHNRLISVASAAYPLAYLEVIAINSEANYGRPDWTRRWFDMDDPVVQCGGASEPRRVHFVASTADMLAARMAV